MMIKSWRCDVQMADKKGIRRICNGKCRECLCGIGMDEWGHERHRADMPEGCDNVRIRNISTIRGRERKQSRPLSSGGKRI